MALHPVILCGGSGTRLWPLSRAMLPKQFLPLAGERTMIQDTALRLAGLEAMPPVVVSHLEQRFLAAEQLREVGVVPSLHLLEPVAKNTAPAIAAAALCVARNDPQALLLVLPSDHAIGDVAGFHAAVRRAVALAGQGRLVTFGMVPAEPATGYGYIRRGAAEGGVRDAFHVAEFVEKPDAARAERFVAGGEHYWNSGMFLFGARRFLDELARLRPEMLAAVEAAVDLAAKDLDFLRLDAEAFGRCKSESVDYAVMEHTRDASVVAAEFGWSDVGSWSALWELQKKDPQGNSIRGDVYLDRTSGSYVRAESRLVAAVGVKDLVIVETDDAVLVAHKDLAQDVKLAVEHLKSSNREEHITHSRVYRPWGYYETLDQGRGFQAKRLMVKPGAKLSLQRHRRRAEHWVVVSGTARVTRDGEEILLGANQSTYIPLGAKHRLENAGAEPLYVIEVQSGDYLGEDDIERFADDYRRT
ncbi:MAG TPA: mannose-1-phosphate guanylyltransferase/mannose-6-phosphate isomerase [Burkholderiales bacterium]